MIWLNDGRKSGMCPFMTRKKDIVLVNLKKKKKIFRYIETKEEKLSHFRNKRSIYRLYNHTLSNKMNQNNKSTII